VQLACTGSFQVCPTPSTSYGGHSGRYAVVKRVRSGRTFKLTVALGLRTSVCASLPNSARPACHQDRPVAKQSTEMRT
jgi:hypothetical protein